MNSAESAAADGLAIWVGTASPDPVCAGTLFKSGHTRNRFVFAYDPQCPPPAAVSLTMPVLPDQYLFEPKLHPIFDMNLPEGWLGERLRRQFAKVIPHFDDLALLRILGASQIGRLRFGEVGPDVPTQDLQQILTHDGAEDLFESLLNQFAEFSGISGAQPKVLVRAATPEPVPEPEPEPASAPAAAPDRISYRGATHIVKAWHENEFPQLAANEYFCMRAAKHAGLEVPNFFLSDNGKLLLVERFDRVDGRYLGFEDFCVLNGKTSAQKYEGSYENITKRIREFVSPEQVRPALEAFFKTLALSCAVKNGDAHLKNFGVLYDDCESVVRLAPAYDIVSTTPYLASDMLALTLGGSKRWPKAKALLGFGQAHCGIGLAQGRVLLDEVAVGVVRAREELDGYMGRTAAFAEIGAVMLDQWGKGLNLSLQGD
jgi:serine/threonine-protein kinase HipA